MRIGLFLLALSFTALSTAGALAATTYFYDALGRLHQVCYDNGVTIIYNYDPAGNRTSVVTQGGCQ